MKKGHKMTIEQRKKMSLAKLGAFNPRFGKVGTCLGRKQTPEQILKIKEARAKQVITEDHKKNITEGLLKAWKEEKGKFKRETWHLWKGGITPANKMLRKTVEYRLWRESVFRRDNYTCQECKVRGGELHPHHIKPFSLFPELRTAIDNGITLCASCHRKTDSWGLRTPKLEKTVGTQV